MKINLNLLEKGAARRILSLTLAVCMVCTMSPSITAAGALASGVSDSGEIVLSGFAALPDEVREQSVPLGTSPVELILPDTLEAAVYAASEDTEPEEEAPPAESEQEKPVPPITPPTVGESEPPPAPSQPQDSGVPPDDVSGELKTESGKLSGEKSEPSGKPVGERIALPLGTTPYGAPQTWVFSAYIESDAPPQSDSGELKADSEKPGSKESAVPATAFHLSGVTWASEPEYNGDIAGTYIFTAVLPDGYSVEGGAALPVITVTVGHILEYGDCMDFDCPTHYPPEVLAMMNEDEDPVPLTLTDLVNDYGIEPPPARRTRAAPNPQTLVVTTDNENNAHTGTADRDMDVFMHFSDKGAPIEVRFDLNSLPTQNAFIAIKAMDVDEEAGEDDHVWVNGKEIGLLSGTSQTWNTTVLEIPIDLLKIGGNYVEVHISKDTFAGIPSWVVSVDWMQLVLDGGEKDANIDSFSLKLGDPVNTNKTVQVPATVTIKQKGSIEYVTEYSLIQTDTGNALDAKFGKAQTQETVSLSMPKNSQSGTYKIIGILKDPATEMIKARDEVAFEFTQNVGVIVGPKMAHTLTPSELTKQSVAIAVSVADANGCTDITIQDGGARTVTANNDYAFTVNYKYNGTARTMTYTVPVTNIDKTPPTIIYTPLTVAEETSDAEIAAMFKAALVVTDDRQLASGMPIYTLPANIATTYGTKNVTVTATDVAGNTATKVCDIMVTALPLNLVQNNPVRVGLTNSFTLSAGLKNTGGDPITETGFVWGIMQSPTTAVNNGTTKTASPVTTKGGTVSGTAADIADGVNYYARPYAVADGKTYYGEQKPFSIGGKQYGTFAVANNSDNTFTITRTGGSEGAQIVYYRTVNGSAVGGTHFTHAASSVIFAAGDTSKTVSITEQGANVTHFGWPATAYTNASRTYQLEIYKVDGGGTITGGVSRATRTMQINENYKIKSNVYETKSIQLTIDTNNNYVCDRDNKPEGGGSGDGAVYFTTDRAYNLGLPANNGGNKNWSTNTSISSLYSSVDSTYITNTAQSYNYSASYTGTEKDDGWELVWVGNHIPNTADPAKTMSTVNYNSAARTLATNDSDLGPAMYTGTFEIKNPAQAFTIPTTTGMANYSYGTGQTDGSNALSVPISDTIYCYFSACGTNIDIWQVNSFSNTVSIVDSREPQLVEVAPMADGTYKPGDTVTIALVFNEIVDSAKSTLASVSLNTTYGTMTYAGGADTNVLYFTGTIPEGASNTVTVNSINNAANIKDMCDQGGTSSGGSGSGSITVDSTKPTVSIANGGITNGTAKGTITGTNFSSLKYTWTQSADMPVSGWISCDSGTVAQTRQTSGTWYLHAIAERSANGNSGYARADFNFGTPENPTSPLPTLAVSADNTSWATSRNITVARTPAAATVTYSGPQSGTASGATVNVAQNGLYTFTLESGGETITEMVSVSRLDAVAPTLTLREPGGTDAVYNTLTFGANASDNLSGIATVEYAVTATSDVPSSGWAALSGSGGSYTGSYTETSATKTTKYIHVRATDLAGNVTTKTSAAYTVVKENAAAAPTITLTGAPTSWVKDPVSLTWTVTNVGAGGTTVMLDGTTSTATSGPLEATGNGLYSVSVTDQNGVSADASCLVEKIDAEAPILTGLTASPSGWAASKTVTLTGVTDNRTPLPDASGTTTGYGGSGLKTREWKLGSAYTAFTGDSFAVTATGTYTVRLTDIVGNQNEYEVLVPQVDNTAPAVTVGTPAANWTSTAQSIAVTYTDGESGIGTAQYAITTTNTGAKPTNLTNLPASSQSVSVSANGTNYIYYKITDNAGNINDGYSAAIMVDTTVPTLALSGGTTAILASNQNGLIITVERSFGASGGKVQVYKDDTLALTMQSDAASFPVVSGKGHVKVVATSNAGKSATEEFDVFQIDYFTIGVNTGKPQVVVGGGTASKPSASAPTRNGYTLTGWNKDGAAYDFATPVNSNITLDAVWALNAPTVSLAVDKANTTYNGVETVATLTATPAHTANGVTYTYEWYKGGVTLDSATGSKVELKTVAESGGYTVKVTASDGTLTSPQVTSSTVQVTINKANTEIATKPTASGITYGQALSDSTLDGGAGSAAASTFLGRIASVFRSGEAVAGTFGWTTGTTKPAVSDSNTTQYSVTFTPTDTANYNTATTTITLAVGKQTLTPSVNAVSNKAYDGNTTATGTVALAGAVPGESPAASGTFAFTTAAAGENKSVNVTGIALTDTWGNNYALSAESLANVTTTAKITPKTIGLAWSGHTGLVYDTNPVSVTATATGLVGTDACTVTVTGGTQTNAGTYTATATVLSNANYALPTAATQTYTIAKAPVTFVVTDNTHDYNGQAKTATVAQTADEAPTVATDKFTVSYEQNDITVASPTVLGIYNVMVEITDANFKHKESSNDKFEVGILTINGVPYPDEITWPTAERLTYGQTLGDSTLTGGLDSGKGIFTWETPATVPTVQNDGYNVTFTPADNNFAPENNIVRITVTKATPTLTLPTAAGITYGDTLADSSPTGGSASATVSGAAANVPGVYTWAAPETMPEFSDSDSTEYALTFTPTDTDNYNVVGTGEIQLAVAQRTVGLAWSGHTGLVYTGSAVNVAATVNNLVGEDACAVTVANGAETDAGTYTAEATALESGNYKLPTVVTQEYTIAKAPVTFAVTNNVYDYDSNAKTATVAQTAGETPSVSGSFTVSYERGGEDVPTPTKAGVYDVLVTLDNANFKHYGELDTARKIKVGTLTINGVPYPPFVNDTMTWPTAEDIIYGTALGNNQLTGGNQAGKGAYAWKSPATVPTVANSGYTVVFTPTDTDYSAVEKIITIKVSKATPTLTTPTAAGITYGDTLADSAFSGGSASAQYNGVAKEVPGKYTWTTPATMPKAADGGTTEYALTFTPTDTGNYNVVGTGKIKLAVAQKPVGLTWAGHTALVYSGAPVSVTATATGLVGSDSCTVTVADGAKTDAGDHIATATALSNPNYKLPATPTQAYTIAKKPLKVLWSDLFPTYDGTAKSPVVALDGVVGGEDCTVLSTGASAGNAGRYKVAAALQGTRSSNYTMQNPGDILVIQPAPVGVSLSDYSYKWDGTAKYAAVTATPNVPLTVTYKLAGKEVTAPTEEGIYDIFVGLNGKNYRFADGADGKARRMGALTIYKEKPPELYTITFDRGAEDAVGTAPTLPPSVKDTVHFLPSNTFLRAGNAFVGWKNGDTLHQSGERFIQPANNNTVFTAQWEAATFDIGGVVDQDGKPIANVRVVLMRGAEQVAETVTDQIGEYHFDNVLPGLYNLVASKPSLDGVGDIIMTIMVEVKAADVEQANITLPSGKTNSIVEVAPGTPKIIVGNLDKTFNNTEGSDFTPEDKELVNKGGTVEIRFKAEEKQESEIAGDAEEIVKEAGGAKVGLYLALDVEKTVTQPVDPNTPDAEPTSDTTNVSETSVLLESVIPLSGDLQGKHSYTIYRIHGGAVDSLTTGADSGERFEVDEDKTTLTLYAQKFSTYAIAYTEKGDSSGGGGGGGDGGGSDWTGDITVVDDTPKTPPVHLPEAPAEALPDSSKPTETLPDKPTDGDGEADADKDGESGKDGESPDKGEPTPEDKLEREKNDALEKLEREKDDALGALERERDKAIDALPDSLTDEQRKAAVDEINRNYAQLVDENNRIYEQAVRDINGGKTSAEIQTAYDTAAKGMAAALASAGGKAGAVKPFVLLSALLALAAVLLAVFAVLKRHGKRRKLVSLVFAALAVIVFLLTTGRNGMALANRWTILIAALAIGAALGVFGKYSEGEDGDAEA